MPQYKILKERTHLFAPNINVAISLDIIRSGGKKEAGPGTDPLEASLPDFRLEAAITEAMKANEILNCRIVLSGSGDAFYETMENPVISIHPVEDNFEEVVCRQQKIVFDLEHGELIRFFIKRIPGGSRMYMIAHHLAGDGLSMAHLVDDILRALSGEKLTFKPMELFSLDSLPKDSQLSGLMRFMMGRLNKKWRKTGKIFLFDDYRRMFAQYWEMRDAEIFTKQINREKMDSIISETKKNHITFNSVLTTAVLQAMAQKVTPAMEREAEQGAQQRVEQGAEQETEQETEQGAKQGAEQETEQGAQTAGQRKHRARQAVDVGMAVDIRQNGYAGMGNFTSGISIQYAYDSTKDFWLNAQKVHALIYAKLDSNAKKYFLNQFMGALDPTLIDSAYFSAFDRYENKTAKTIARMFGYNGRPKGISITNLAKIPVSSTYSANAPADSAYRANSTSDSACRANPTPDSADCSRSSYSAGNFYVVPPLVPNARRIFGMATQGGVLSMTLHVSKDACVGEEKTLFEKAVANLLSL